METVVGIVIFFVAVALTEGMLATASLAAVGVAIGSAIDNLEFSTVQVTDENGRTETYSLNDLLSGTDRLEVYGDTSERVTIDMNLSQITVQESGKDAATVVINALLVNYTTAGAAARRRGTNRFWEARYPCAGQE